MLYSIRQTFYSTVRRSSSLLIVFSIFGFTPAIGDSDLEAAVADFHVSGYVNNDQANQFIEILADRFQGRELIDQNRSIAKVILLLIDDEFVVNDEFALPKDVDLPIEVINYLTGQNYREEKCNVGNLTLADIDERITIAVLGSKDPNLGFLKNCIGYAFMTAFTLKVSPEGEYSARGIIKEIESLLVDKI